MGHGTDYRVLPVSQERLVVLDLLRLAARQRTVHELVEVDVTTARRRSAGAVDPPTLTAFLLASLGRAVARHPELNARRAGRRLVLFDEVAVAVSVEHGPDAAAPRRPAGLREVCRRHRRRAHRGA